MRMLGSENYISSHQIRFRKSRPWPFIPKDQIRIRCVLGGLQWRDSYEFDFRPVLRWNFNYILENQAFMRFMFIKAGQNPRVEDFQNPLPRSIRLYFKIQSLKIKIHLVCKIQNPGFKIHFVHSKSFFSKSKIHKIQNPQAIHVIKRFKQQRWSNRDNSKISPCVKIHAYVSYCRWTRLK